jgi:hypothetical protein
MDLRPHGMSRRAALARMACGFGSVAMAGLASGQRLTPLHEPRAKRVIFLFMQGGVSQVDSFDHKPLLTARDGEMINFADARTIAKTGKGAAQRVMKPLWEMKRRGQSGLYSSELFPHMARHMDDVCVVRSMHTEGVAHGPATLFLHTGSTSFVRPSMGAWVSYGLGSESENLPAFVTISPAMGNGGPRNYGSAFLPARFQGTPLGRSGQPARDAAFRHLTSPLSPRAAEADFALTQALNAAQHAARPHDTALESVIASSELAWRMQSAAPQAMDLDAEPDHIKALYGINEAETDNYGRQCLMARRLAESGVRFIQVNYGDNSNNPAWDQHSDLPKHAQHARAVDKPVAGLLADLKQRGLLEDTIVWWGGEFGRTPYAEKNGTGRDHNPGGFSIWVAGGGFKAGHAYGETDEWGHRAIANKVHMHDLHATLLHQLGLDHERLTYRYLGRDFRLTDVHGHVVRGLVT